MEQRDLTGTVIDNQIEILESIGEGGMGAVFRAFHRGWNQPMAVKVPHHFLLTSQADRERFLLEAHTWIDLGIHPHIVTCWFIHPLEGIPLLFLDLLSGGNLKDEIHQGRLRRGDWPRILALAIQACDGLAHAHQLGLIHRDIKPANLLLDDSGRLCVTDFGLVKNLSNASAAAGGRSPGGQMMAIQDLSLSLTTTGSVVGTPHYASPEQWMQDDQLSARADLYSLGVVLYEMAVGHVPFDPPSGPQAISALFIAHTTQNPPDPASLQPDVPEGLREVILSCLSKDPADRPKSAAEMRNRLSEVYRKTTNEPYPEVPQAAQQRPDSLNNKAVSLWNLGKRNLGLAAWNEALTFDALHPESVFNRAMVQWAEGKIEPEEVIRRLRTVRATHPRAAAYLGLFLLTRGQAFEAEIELRTALESAEVACDSRFWKALGDCQMLGERMTEAQESYGRSLELSSQQVDVSSRLKLASKFQRPKDLDRLFPRCRPLWETALEQPAVEIYFTADRVVCLQDSNVISLKRSDGSLQWTSKTIDTPQLCIAEHVGLWSYPKLPNAPLYRLSDGKVHLVLSEGDKLFAFDPTGGRAIVGNIDLWLVEIPPGDSTSPSPALKRVFKMTGHDKQVTAAVFSPSGQVVVTGGYDRAMIIWSTRNGQPLHRTQRHKDYIESIAISPDGKFVATGSRDRTVRVTAIDSGESYQEFKDHPSAVVKLQFTPDSKKLLAGCASGTQGGFIQSTAIWDLADGSLIKRFEGHARLTADGAYLLVPRYVAGVHSLDVCKLDSLAWVRQFPTDSAVLASVDCPEGRYVCFSTGRSETLAGTVCYWEFSEKSRLVPSGLHLTRTRSYRDLESTRKAFQGLLVKANRALEGKDYRTAWSELEAARALTGYYRDPEALQVAAQLLKVLPRDILRGIWEQKVVKDPSQLPVGQALWLDQGTAISSAGKWLRLWNATTGSCTGGLVGHSDTVTALDCVGTRAFSGSSGKGLRLWSLASGECEKGYTAVSLGFSWVSLHASHNKACCFNYSQELLWLDLATGKFVNSFRLAGAQHVSTSADWNYAVAGGNPGHPCLSAWNLNSPKRIADEKRFQAAADAPEALQCTAVCVLNSGTFALVASIDGMIRLWDLQDIRCLEKYRGSPQDGPVTSISWSDDGHHFVCGHDNGSLRVWALSSTHRPIKELAGHWGKVMRTRLTHDARFLLTVTEDKTLRFWELDWALDSSSKSKELRVIYPRPGLLARLFKRRS